MAPEVCLSKTYDSKCDVFSFAILSWEILSLRKAFDGMTGEEFVNQVMIERERLPINNTWPALTRVMLADAWDNIPQKRPAMKEITKYIRGDLTLLTSDDSILQRSIHYNNRSLTNQCKMLED
jgi:Protein tyrosine and serine/threonine kinase